MSFLNPALLACTAAVAVPILIHLLNRRRFQRVSWAAMRFVRASLEKNRRRMQIEDLLLLALRCLIVGLFAFALARPAWRSAPAASWSSRVLLDPRPASMPPTAPARLALARQPRSRCRPAAPVSWCLAGDVTTRIPEPAYDLTRPQDLGTRPSDLATDHAAGISAAEVLRAQTALRRRSLVTDRQALAAPAKFKRLDAAARRPAPGRVRRRPAGTRHRRPVPAGRSAQIPALTPKSPTAAPAVAKSASRSTSMTGPWRPSSMRAPGEARHLLPRFPEGFPLFPSRRRTGPDRRRGR
jgi:hypothetical protein